MPASSFQDLYKFSENISAALKAVLVADVVTLIGSDTTADANAFIFGPLENEDGPSDRIDVSASTFTSASAQHVPATVDGVSHPCHYAGEFGFTVITPRGDPLATAEHGTRVGRILFLMSPRAARLTGDALPYYEIVSLTLASVPATVQDADGNDRTEITYNAELWIKPGAFPAVAP